MRAFVIGGLAVLAQTSGTMAIDGASPTHGSTVNAAITTMGTGASGSAAESVYVDRAGDLPEAAATTTISAATAAAFKVYGDDDTSNGADRDQFAAESKVVVAADGEDQGEHTPASLDDMAAPTGTHAELAAQRVYSLAPSDRRRLAHISDRRALYADFKAKLQKFHQAEDEHIKMHHHISHNLETLGRHGHHHEQEVHSLNIFIMEGGARHRVQPGSMLAHHFHERFLSHKVLTELQVCTHANLGEAGLPQGELEHRRRRLSQAAHSCRTPMERCMDNRLKPHYEDLEAKSGLPHLHKDNHHHPDSEHIREAARHCRTLSSVPKKLVVQHRDRYRETYDGHPKFHHKLNPRSHPIENPRTYSIYTPPQRELEHHLRRMLAGQDRETLDMIHCMTHRLQHKGWHEQHGADNPHSWRLANIHCHHDILGMYDRTHALHGLEANWGEILTAPPYIGNPRIFSLERKPTRIQEQNFRLRELDREEVLGHQPPRNELNRQWAEAYRKEQDQLPRDR